MSQIRKGIRHGRKKDRSTANDLNTYGGSGYFSGRIITALVLTVGLG